MTLSSTLKNATAAGAVLIGAALAAAPAFAGECPPNQVAANAMQPGATAPKHVTDTVIGSIDLAGYDVDGKTMRMRKLVVKPGGIVPWHSHAERPANIYIVSGAITEYRSTCKIPIEHKAGEVAVESGDLAHWWKNNTNKDAVLISADIVATPMMSEGGM
jgi:quercetin dioxygenase-like cupin family protein